MVKLNEGDVSGKQFREAISARSNFGLGFALTHTLIKSDDSHRKSTSLSIHLHSRLGMDIELMVLSYLGCDSGRNPSSLAFYAFAVFTRGLPALVVCLAGAVEAGVGWSPRSSDEGGPRIKEEEGY